MAGAASRPSPQLHGAAGHALNLRIPMGEARQRVGVEDIELRVLRHVLQALCQGGPRVRSRDEGTHHLLGVRGAEVAIRSTSLEVRSSVGDEPRRVVAAKVQDGEPLAQLRRARLRCLSTLAAVHVHGDKLRGAAEDQCLALQCPVGAQREARIAGCLRVRVARVLLQLVHGHLAVEAEALHRTRSRRRGSNDTGLGLQGPPANAQVCRVPMGEVRQAVHVEIIHVGIGEDVLHTLGHQNVPVWNEGALHIFGDGGVCAVVPRARDAVLGAICDQACRIVPAEVHNGGASAKRCRPRLMRVSTFTMVDVCRDDLRVAAVNLQGGLHDAVGAQGHLHEAMDLRLGIA
mmetsp:Transcript_142758/g.456217  ORF Transcript_142758/g.456217 Transcript_142758/m.456217 type:complete len:346 (+) Transcript_142758:302-1339(+)